MKVFKKAQAGMTMLEVVIASIILVAVVIMVFMLLFSASNEQSDQQTVVHMDNQILEVLNRIAADLRNSGGTFSFLDPSTAADTAVASAVFPTGLDSFYDDTATPKYPGLMNYHTSLSFGINTGFQIVGKAGVATFNATTVRYFWRYAFGETADNNLDDNSDGLIDEGDIVREETTGGVTTSSVLCRNVARRGLVFQFPNQSNPPSTVIISMKLLGRDRKGVVINRWSSLSAGPRT